MRSRASADGSPIAIGASVAASRTDEERKSAARRLDRGGPHPYQHERLVGQDRLRQELEQTSWATPAYVSASITPKRT